MLRPVCLTCPMWDDPGCGLAEDCECYGGNPREAWEAYQNDYLDVDWDWLVAELDANTI